MDLNVKNIKVHKAKNALIKDIGPVNRVYLTVLVSVENIYVFVLLNYVAEFWNSVKLLHLEGLEGRGWLRLFSWSQGVCWWLEATLTQPDPTTRPEQPS